MRLDYQNGCALLSLPIVDRNVDTCIPHRGLSRAQRVRPGNNGIAESRERPRVLCTCHHVRQRSRVQSRDQYSGTRGGERLLPSLPRSRSRVSSCRGVRRTERNAGDGKSRERRGEPLTPQLSSLFTPRVSLDIARRHPPLRRLFLLSLRTSCDAPRERVRQVNTFAPVSLSLSLLRLRPKRAKRIDLRHANISYNALLHCTRCIVIYGGDSCRGTRK